MCACRTSSAKSGGNTGTALRLRTSACSSAQQRAGAACRATTQCVPSDLEQAWLATAGKWEHDFCDTMAAHDTAAKAWVDTLREHTSSQEQHKTSDKSPAEVCSAQPQLSGLTSHTCCFDSYSQHTWAIMYACRCCGLMTAIEPCKGLQGRSSTIPPNPFPPPFRLMCALPAHVPLMNHHVHPAAAPAGCEHCCVPASTPQPLLNTCSPTPAPTPPLPAGVCVHPPPCMLLRPWLHSTRWAPRSSPAS